MQVQNLGIYSPYDNVYQRTVACLKLISNVFSVHQGTCLISHMSAYIGANVP